jgi:MFS family permease
MVTIVPLFLATLTDSALVIGVILSLPDLAWRLPQLLVAQRVSRLRRYKPFVLLTSFHERWPLFGLALTALSVPILGTQAALVLATLFVTVQWTAGGLSAPSWYALMAKIVPVRHVGAFFGSHAANAYLFAAGGALAAGILLENLAYPGNFALCFALGGASLMISQVLLAQTREAAHDPTDDAAVEALGKWQHYRAIWRRDANFRAYVVVRMLGLLAWTVLSFITLYVIRRFAPGEQVIGVLGSLFLLAQTLANPLLGWLGDRVGHRRVFVGGAVALIGSVGLLAFAPSLAWVYVAFALAGAANVANQIVAGTLNLAFGARDEKPLYIGLSNTLVAPVSLLAPIASGWLVDTSGFEALFVLTGAAAAATALLLLFGMAEPEPTTPH